MMTSRVALGSVSTLAAAALLLGAAPLMLNHTLGSVHATPWGQISSISGNGPSSPPGEGDRSQLLRLAALKGSKVEATQTDPAMAAAAQLSATPAKPSAPDPVLDTASTNQAITTPATPPDTASASPAVAAPAVDGGPGDVALADPPQAEAGEADAVPLPPTAPARSVGSLININTASPDTLDRFPGTGRIGRAIVSHRPYHSIDDLVRKRVLRTSDFQRIHNRISVD